MQTTFNLYQISVQKASFVNTALILIHVLSPLLHCAADPVCRPEAGVQQKAHQDRTALFVSLHLSVLYR